MAIEYMKLQSGPISQIHKKKNSRPPLRYSIFKPKLSNSVIKAFDLTASHDRSHDLTILATVKP